MKQKKVNQYSKEDLRWYIALPVREKLRLIEQMNNFFDRFMPKTNKKIWSKLQDKGY